MAREYKPKSGHPVADPKRCKAKVSDPGKYGSFFPRQCSRKPWKDGWCRQHHPDTEANRQAENELRRIKKRNLRLLTRNKM